MLAITDFIKILRVYYISTNASTEQLEEYKLDTWRSVLYNKVMPLVSLGSDASLYDAIWILVHNRTHRLSVINIFAVNVLYILTDKHTYFKAPLFLYINNILCVCKKKLEVLKIGTYYNIETVLKTFLEHRVSDLPLVDSENPLFDMYANFDVIIKTNEQ